MLEHTKGELEREQERRKQVRKKADDLELEVAAAREELETQIKAQRDEWEDREQVSVERAVFS